MAGIPCVRKEAVLSCRGGLCLSEQKPRGLTNSPARPLGSAPASSTDGKTTRSRMLLLSRNRVRIRVCPHIHVRMTAEEKKQGKASILTFLFSSERNAWGEKQSMSTSSIWPQALEGELRSESCFLLGQNQSRPPRSCPGLLHLEH